MEQPIAITPEEFNPDIHSLPIAGELLMAGCTAVIRTDGRVYNRTTDDTETHPHGLVIEFCKSGEMVELTAQTTDEDEGGIFISKLWVIVSSS